MPNEARESYPRLVGDIGGTNSRFALILAPGEDFTAPQTLACADFPGPAEAVEHYLAALKAPRPRRAAIGIANPIIGDLVRMTNHHWAFSIEALRRSLGLDRLSLLNDFTMLALSLPVLKAGDLEMVGRGSAVAGAPLALIGPGTGLGVSGLLPAGKGYLAIEGEGGHVTLPPWDDREDDIITRLRHRYKHVSAERVLSGPGLVALYEAVAELAGAIPEPYSAADISSRGIAGGSALCTAALDAFCAMLGTVAANLALTLGARGGVYIGGGIVPRLGGYFAASPFRSRFEQKGRFSDYLAAIPTYVIRAPYPGLMGAAQQMELG